MATFVPHADQFQIPLSGSPVFCNEKFRLLDDFVEAVHTLGWLQTAQTRAVIHGEPDLPRFDLALAFALKKKEKAKSAWMVHVQEHGCHDTSLPSQLPERATFSKSMPHSQGSFDRKR